MFCQYCGHEINKTDLFCAFCGKQLAPIRNTRSKAKNSESNLAYGILSFFIPIAGLVLFICWKKEFPKRAKYSGIGAIIGAVAQIVVIALYILLIYFLSRSVA